MAVIAAHQLEGGMAATLLDAQKGYSAAQREMAIDSAHLMWVIPKRRSLPASLRAKIFERDAGLCTYCGCELTEDDFTVDHIWPVSKGGNDDEDNLTLACLPCNCSKGAK